MGESILKVYTVSELNELLVQSRQIIGHGGFGEVYKVALGQRWAAVKIPRAEGCQATSIRSMMKEVELA